MNTEESKTFTVPVGNLSREEATVLIRAFIKTIKAELPPVNYNLPK